MHKKDPADIVTESYMAIVERASERSKAAEMLTTVSVLTLIFVFGILIWVLPKSDFSPDENKSLTTFPKFSLSSLVDGGYSSDIGSFYADQFPARRRFVSLKAICELAQLKMQNNSVIPAAGGNLVKRLEYNDYSAARANLDAISDFDAALSSLGIPLTVALAPRAVDVLAHSLPPTFGSERTDGIWNVIRDSGVESVDLDTPLTLLSTRGEYVWYKTDHHWTTWGAYQVYLALAGALGYEPESLSYFTVEQVSDQFYGTTYSSSGMSWSSPDSIDYFRFEGDEQYIVENMLTREITEGFYQTSYLEAKDKYSSFLGQNSAYIRVYKPNAVRPTLLLIKDSYAHSLAPFLAIHFNLEIIDLRYYTGSAAALARDTSASAVLILLGVDSLASSRDLMLLRYGLASLNN